MRWELLKSLCEVPGTPGREEKVRKLVLEAMKPLVDEIRVDAMGNVIGKKRGSGQRRVMLAAHMDEIGFLVSAIDDNGFLHILPVGGFDPRTLFAQRVVVHGREQLKGILMPGTKPIHISSPEETSKVPGVDEFFIDVGLKKEKLSTLVRVGDFVTMDRECIQMGDMVNSKALDDRLGVFVMLEALQSVTHHEVDIYAVATVQEEQGLRGALTGAYGIEPDLGVALDVTVAADIPGNQPHKYVTRLGGGTAIKIMDSASIGNYKLVEFMREVAEKNNISYQMEILPRGGTDAGAIERTRTGCPVMTISVPARYVHTAVETSHKKDIEASISLLARFLEVAHTADVSL